MRAAVGDAVLLLPSVMVVPRDDQGRVLLVRHSDSGHWGTIGGSVEIDESPADAARREAKEEANIDVELGSVIAVLGGPGYRVRYANGDEASYVATVYEAHVVSSSPAAPDDDEVTEVRWVSLEELGGLDLSPYHRVAFAELGWL